MGLDIVSADIGMADEVGAIHAAAWKQAYRSILPDDYLEGVTASKRSDLFRRMVQTGACEYYVFRVDQKSAGFAAICGAEDEPGKDRPGEISALYFLSDFWGFGHAQEAMRFCVARLQALGYREAILWVLEENRRACRFYHKSGFSPDGARKEIVLGKPLIELRYRKTIA